MTRIKSCLVPILCIVFFNTCKSQYIIEIQIDDLKTKLSKGIIQNSKCLENDLYDRKYFENLFALKGRESVLIDAFNRQKIKSENLENNVVIIFSNTGEIVIDHLISIDLYTKKSFALNQELGKLTLSQEKVNINKFKIIHIKNREKMECDNLPKVFMGSYLVYFENQKLKVKMLSDSDLRSILNY